MKKRRSSIKPVDKYIVNNKEKRGLKMNAVGQLTEDIELLKNQLKLYEEKLKSVQRSCDHQYVEKFMHQKCLKCHYVESLYY